MSLPKVTVYYQDDAKYPPTPGKYEGDVGIDIRANFGDRPIHELTLLPGHGMWIPGGFFVQFGPGWAGLVLPRSSTNQMGLHVFTGVIDNGYAGIIGAQVQNLTCDPIHLSEGARIAQLVLIPAFRPDLVPVAHLRPTDRGSNGWGSSGT